MCPAPSSAGSAAPAAPFAGRRLRRPRARVAAARAGAVPTAHRRRGLRDPCRHAQDPRRCAGPHRPDRGRRRPAALHPTPTEEYRTPSDAEWEEFLGRFRTPQSRHRHLAAARSPPPAFTSTSCLRCALHRPDPAQRDHRRDPRQPHRPHRRSRPRSDGWIGEAEGAKISLADAQDKLAQIDRRAHTPAAVGLGMPALSRTHATN
jgi:hypothetical protein